MLLRNIYKMMQRILEYIHRPNKTEVGVETNTNDSYLKLAPAIEKTDMFVPNEVESFLYLQKGEEVIFKAVKYPSNNEYRLTKLGAVRKRFDIKCGDELVFRKVISDGSVQRFFEIKKFEKTMFYLSSKKRYILINPNLLPDWKEDGVGLTVWYKGRKVSLEISFVEKKPARSDSPTPTDYYCLKLAGTELSGKSYCLSKRNGEMHFDECVKWTFNEIKY